MADKRIDQLVAATTVGDDDLLVLQQNNQAKKLSGKKLGDYVYAAAAGKIAEVEQAVADAQAAIDDLEEQKDTIAQAVAAMADLGTDTTLTTAGMAADAEAPGNKINGAEIAALGSFDQAEITGVAIATFDDGADNIPVKALEIAVDPVQDLHGYANPWPAGGGKNLFQTTVTTQTVNGKVFTVNDDGTITATNTATANIGSFAFGEVTLPAGSYKVNGLSNGAQNAGRMSVYNVTAASTIASIYGGLDYPFTLEAESTIRIGAVIFNGDSTTYTFKPMIRLSSVTDATFAPYSNICPITGWTGANVTVAGKNMFDPNAVKKWYYSSNVFYTMPDPNSSITWTVDDDGTINVVATTGYRGIGINIKPVSYERIFSITGSASRLLLFEDYAVGAATRVSATNNLVIPANTEGFLSIRFDTAGTYTLKPQFENGSTTTAFEKCNATTIPITFPTEAGTVYGAKLINEGTKTWKLRVDGITVIFDGTGNYNGNYFPTMVSPTLQIQGDYDKRDSIKCSHQKTGQNGGVSNSNMAGSGIQWQNVDTIYGVSNANEFLAYLAAQYASGTPMQVYYPIKNPVEYTITGEVVETLLGLNNIWADTGNILDLIYRKRPISVSDIQENIDAIRDIIADREDSGIASKNYSFGALILVGNNLYEADGPIATGESIVPGSNCTATTVSEQITYIKSVINSLGNLAYLSYENA